MSDYSQSSYAQSAPPAYTGAPQNGGAAPAALPKKFAILGLVGSLVAAVGSLVNWVVSEEDMSDGGIKGMDGDGVITLIISLVAAVLFIVTLARPKAPLYIGGGLLGAGAAVVAAINMADPARLVAQYLEEKGASTEQAEKVADQLSDKFTAGPGIYMVLIGGLLALALGLVGFMKARKSN
ncbi:hypothetical protein HUT19_23495 [Streptomyces sp. NA02950]|uniref:hypothetical protein n=1 Tax=Streptomyces sp. NA02950 TaxID=2742137 RepID=UPI0015923399|nr:hypothetical protein [Streptomyces sp. NA02950]QKV94354.1 hypothetical protein HUT19_23495 [Streptomyces sp. NA02950]